MTKQQLIRRVHKYTKDITSHLYSDSSWNAVTELFHTLNELGGEVYLLESNYRDFVGDYTDVPPSKEYKIAVDFEEYDIILDGIITAHSAGTMEDPFAHYDVTINLW